MIEMLCLHLQAIVSFLVIGCVFIPIGAICLAASHSVRFHRDTFNHVYRTVKRSNDCERTGALSKTVQ